MRFDVSAREVHDRMRWNFITFFVTVHYMYPFDRRERFLNNVFLGLIHHVISLYTQIFNHGILIGRVHY